MAKRTEGPFEYWEVTRFNTDDMSASEIQKVKYDSADWQLSAYAGAAYGNK